MGQHTVLAGRYELVSPLGRGGMGQVWEGQDQRLERRIAVKLLTNEVLAGRAEPQELVRRFAREAAVTAGLQHPGVPAVYDAGTYDGGLFLVMELVGGCALGDLMAEQGPLPVAWAAGIAAQVAAVLAAAHERRLVHRDVKPQNVMITPDGSVKVLDFGVAAVLDQAGAPRITRTGEPIGTLAYMAPEQLHSRPATAHTDLYALGCVLYEMLAGRPIFDSTSPAGLMHKHLEQAPEPLHREDLPHELDSLVQQLLEKDPLRRPADAQETYDRLLPHVTSPGPLGDLDPAINEQTGMHLYSRVLVRFSASAEPQHDASLAGTRLTATGLTGAHLTSSRVTDMADALPWQSAWSGPQPTAGSNQGGHGQGWHGQGGQGQGWQGQAGGNGSYEGGHPYPAGQWVGAHVSGPRPALARSFGWKFVHSLWLLPTLLFGIGTWLSFGYIAARHRRLSWMLASAAYLVLGVSTFALIGAGPEQENPLAPDPISTTIGMVMLLILWPAGFLHAFWVNVTVRLRLRDQHESEPWEHTAPDAVPSAQSYPLR